MSYHSIKKSFCLILILLLCMSTTVFQSNAFSEPCSSINLTPISPIEKNLPPVTNDIDINGNNLSSPTINSSIIEPTSYDAVASTSTASSPDPRMPTSDNCVYSFQNVGSGRYATSTNNYLYVETHFNIYQTSSNLSEEQHFRLEDAGDGYYFIIPLEYNGSEGRRMCAILPDGIGFIENVFYTEYSEDSEYEFRWRIEFVETYDNRLDYFAIFLGDSNYVLTAMTNNDGSHENSGTAAYDYATTGNICVTSYQQAHFYGNGYHFKQEHQYWRLFSGQRQLYYGYNVRNASALDVCTTEINLHFACPVTQYGDTCSIASNSASILGIDNSDFSVLPNMTVGYTILIAYTYDSNGVYKDIITRPVYVYLPNGTYYFSDISDSYLLSVSPNQMTSYNGNEPTQNKYLYKLHYVGSGKYCILSSTSSAVVWGVSENALTMVGVGVLSDYSQVADSLKWTIEESENGYRIYNVSNNYASLTVPNPLTNGSSPYLVSRSYTNVYQLWDIQRARFISGGEIGYNPTVWNDPNGNNVNTDNHIHYITNCYNYAYNNQTKYRLHEAQSSEIANGIQPGMLGGVLLDRKIMSKAHLLELLEYDKAAVGGITLIQTNSYSVCPSNGYKVALWYDQSSQDYHWYRQNPDGTWSHKPGQLEVTNIDTHGNIIVDMQNLNTLYSTFVGHYYVIPKNIIAPIETAPIVDIDIIYHYPSNF